MNKWDTWEKWIDSKWFLRGVALLLAVMLFFSATWEGEIEKQSLLGSKAETETVTNIPLELYYDQENLVVTGAPANVTVDLTGPTNIAKSASVQKQFSIYADLRELPLGTHTVELKYKNASEKLLLKIIPETITVEIQEKVTKEFNVEVDYINKDQMKSGFTVESAKATPASVSITGAKDKVGKIALVKTIVDLKGVDESFTTDAKVLVYDAAGNPLDVVLEQEEVSISVGVLSPNKELPVEFTVAQPLPAGYALVSIAAEQDTVLLYSRKSQVLEKLPKTLVVPLDLSKLKKTSTLDVELPLPKGVTYSVPGHMKVIVTVEKEIKKQMKNIKIRVDDLADGQTATFISPEKGTVDVTVVGSSEVINKFSSKDIRVYFSIDKKEIGKYQAKLELDLPDNVKGTLSVDTVEYEVKEAKEE